MARGQNRRDCESFELKIVPVTDIPKQATAIPTENLAKVYRICQEMQEVCEKNNGVGLSAFQVGIPWNLFVIKFSIPKFKDKYEYYLECDYQTVDDKVFESIEGCLSLKTPDGGLDFYKVSRHAKIKVIGKKLLENGSLVDFEEIIDGYYATVFAHEIDHQKGILISDIGTPVHVY